MEEIWKDIEGYEGIYQVSSLGRVKSLARVITRSTGADYSVIERILKTANNPSGYEVAILSTNGKMYPVTVHRLVAKAFIPNPENKETINHKNGVKTDNRVSNLEWHTRSENVKHAYDVLGVPTMKGEKNASSKLTDQQVREIKTALLDEKVNQAELSRKYKVGKSTINRIKFNTHWKHITI
jgi:DNA-binding Xre family transcriptional regulator